MQDLVVLGVGFVLAGFLLIFLAAIMGSRRKDGEGAKTDGGVGGVIMIGPIPIIFGSSPRWAVLAILLAIVLTILGLLLARAV